MIIAFFVNRIGYYKFYGPIVDAAFYRGHTVECWLYQGEKLDGVKEYQRPTIDNIPSSIKNKVNIRIFNDLHKTRLLLKISKANLIFSILPKKFYFYNDIVDSCFVMLQNGIDSFVNSDFESLCSSDYLCLYSLYWMDWAASYYEAIGDIDKKNFTKTLADKVIYSGHPMLDIISKIDPDQVRQRWGISKKQPVVLLLPVTLSNSPGAWSRFFQTNSRIIQTIVLIIGSIKEDMKMLWEYLPWVWKGFSDKRLTNAIREFCDNNRAFLIAKGRIKDPIRPLLLDIADKTIYDESIYPGTIFEALLIADVCIHFYSTVVFEASSSFTYGVCISRPSPRFEGEFYPPMCHQLFWSNNPRSAFNYRGVNRWITIPEAINKLPRIEISDLKIDNEKRKEYIEKYLGFSDWNSSQRILDFIEKL